MCPVYLHTFRLNDSLHVIFDKNNMFLLWKARDMRLSFDFLFTLFRIAWWPCAGKEQSSWISACAVLYFMLS